MRQKPKAGFRAGCTLLVFELTLALGTNCRSSLVTITHVSSSFSSSNCVVLRPCSFTLSTSAISKFHVSVTSEIIRSVSSIPWVRTIWNWMTTRLHPTCFYVHEPWAPELLTLDRGITRRFLCLILENKIYSKMSLNTPMKTLQSVKIPIRVKMNIIMSKKPFLGLRGISIGNAGWVCRKNTRIQFPHNTPWGGGDEEP